VPLLVAEVRWRVLLNRLLRRALTGVKLTVSGDHAGLKAGRQATLRSVPWPIAKIFLNKPRHPRICSLDADVQPPNTECIL